MEILEVLTAADEVVIWEEGISALNDMQLYVTLIFIIMIFYSFTWKFTFYLIE